MSTARALPILLAGMLFCASVPAGAFECPRPERSGPGVLQETEADQSRLSQAFGSGDIEDDIGIAVAYLQKKYPGVSDTELVDYLLAAYCPAVARMPGLTDAQRTGKVEHFAATVFELLSQQKL